MTDFDDKISDPCGYISPTAKNETVSELKSFSWYLLVLLVFFIALNYLYPLYRGAKRHAAGGENTFFDFSAFEKTDFMKKHSDDYDLIFIGDSRSCIGIDPEIISSHTGDSVLNGASLANWFQTQYPQYNRLAPYLKGKTVVWTINNTNFSGSVDFGAFSMNPKEFIYYIKLGFEPGDIIDNLLMNYLDHEVIFLNDDALKNILNSKMEKVVYRGAAQETPDGKKINVADAGRDPEYDENLIRCMNRAKEQNGIVLRSGYADDTKKPEVIYKIAKSNGQLEYCELDSKYLRSSQEMNLSEHTALTEFNGDPKFMKLFDAMLENFKRNDVYLIVNEYHDAPYNYVDQSNNRAYAEFMKKIRAKVESMGFQYITVDFSSFSDDDYFDHNHLNTDGSIKYSHILGKRLGEVLD